jgi:hypothetical protein
MVRVRGGGSGEAVAGPAGQNWLGFRPTFLFFFFFFNKNINKYIFNYF